MQSRSDFDGKVRNRGPCVLKFDYPLPEDHRANILSTNRQSPSPLQTRRGAQPKNILPKVVLLPKRRRTNNENIDPCK